MKKYNYYKILLKAYNIMPKPIKFCISHVVCWSHGSGWYGTLALKGILFDVEHISIENYKRLLMVQKDMPEEFNVIVDDNFWDLI